MEVENISKTTTAHWLEIKINERYAVEIGENIDVGDMVSIKNIKYPQVTYVKEIIMGIEFNTIIVGSD